MYTEHFVCFVMLRHIYSEIPITWSYSWLWAVVADDDDAKGALSVNFSSIAIVLNIPRDDFRTHGCGRLGLMMMLRARCPSILVRSRSY